MPRYVRRFESPDEVVEADLVRSEHITTSGVTISRDTLQPGWRWTTHMQSRMGTDLCEAHHLGMVTSGRIGVRFRDGIEVEVGPGEIMDIPPGHDTWTIGDEPAETLTWSGARAWLSRLDSLSQRVLATMLFTDIVDSTRRAGEMGEGAWVDALARFQAASRDLVARYRGRVVTTTGDGVLATFDGAARGLRCAMDLSSSARDIGLPIRAAVHTGEIALDDDDIHGLAVHEASRILGLAGADEVLASEATVSLAADAGFEYEDRGTHQLRGIDGSRQLYRVV